MPYEVSKAIHFCYGHRLLGYDGPCRFLHGHNARAEVIVAAAQLDAHGMAHDFRAIKQIVKTWIDAHLDHRMLLQRGDPVAEFLAAQGEPLYLMDVPPTAENIAREIFVHAREHGLPVTAVRLWETHDSCAIFTPTK